ncbi:Noc2p family protein [Dictyocaulus viviparus]|uniref:Noc2p family protein n=1 Tax=Dictyocaulus viviparus TaxID=29172 RepID=A0A0D8XIU7_DICVI|nr:Noc2p family protein [Dictyocaulus viviparus]
MTVQGVRETTVVGVKAGISREKKESDNKIDSNRKDNIMLARSKYLCDVQRLNEMDAKPHGILQNDDDDIVHFQVPDDNRKKDVVAHISNNQKIEEQRMPATKKDNSGRLLFDGRMLDYLQRTTHDINHVRLEDIRLAVEAFSACVSRVGVVMELPKYIINEQAIFYGTVRLCFERLGNVFMTLATGETKVDSGQKEQESGKTVFKNIRRYQAPLKQYLSSILTGAWRRGSNYCTFIQDIDPQFDSAAGSTIPNHCFVKNIQTSEVIVSTLKAIRAIVDLYALFKKIAKNLTKVLVCIWSRKSWNCRVGAYVCMMKLVKNHPEHFVVLYKCCYLGFVSSSRHVTDATWPLIHFAHRTFAELTVLHPNLAYPYAFVYIRQIAIHLRNAIISKKRKDMVQTVYNWQIMQCLYLWTRVLSKAHSVYDCEAISELCYPLTQIIYGMLKLYQSLRYVPLRLHCISLLIQIQANSGTFVPTIAFAADLLSDVELIFAKKLRTMKDVKADLECTLKVSIKVLEDASWRTKLCDHLFRIILQAAHLVSAQPSFPDIIAPITFRIRNSLRKIRSIEFVKNLRTLLEKLEEHAEFVEEVLIAKELNIKDDMKTMSLKHDLSIPNSPLGIYFRQWEKIWHTKERLNLKENKNKRNSQQERPKTSINPEAIDAAKPRKTCKLVTTVANEDICDQFDDIETWSDSS